MNSIKVLGIGGIALGLVFAIAGIMGIHGARFDTTHDEWFALNHSYSISRRCITILIGAFMMVAGTGLLEGKRWAWGLVSVAFWLLAIGLASQGVANSLDGGPWKSRLWAVVSQIILACIVIVAHQLVWIPFKRRSLAKEISPGAR